MNRHTTIFASHKTYKSTVNKSNIKIVLIVSTTFHLTLNTTLNSDISHFNFLKLTDISTLISQSNHKRDKIHNYKIIFVCSSLLWLIIEFDVPAIVLATCLSRQWSTLIVK